MPTSSVFGCIESSGITRKLSPIRRGNDTPYILGRPFAANAPWVVGLSRHERVEPEFGPPGDSLAVTARNIAFGSVTSTCHIDASKKDVYPTVVKKVVIARNGTFAWSGTEEIGGPSGPIDTRVVAACIYSHGPTGWDVRAATGPNDHISFRSLVLRGKTLEWDEGQAHCSVRLKGDDPALSSRAVCE
jgi:hypothetical protein